MRGHAARYPRRCRGTACRPRISACPDEGRQALPLQRFRTIRTPLENSVIPAKAGIHFSNDGPPLSRGRRRLTGILRAGPQPHERWE